MKLFIQIAIIVQTLAVIANSSYPNDTNSVKDTRLYVGMGSHSSAGVSFITESRFYKGFHFLIGGGYKVFDGFIGNVGFEHIWFLNKRYRPLLHLSLSHSGGSDFRENSIVLDGSETFGTIERSNYLNFYSGVMFNIWKWLGVSGYFGYRYAVTGGEYIIISSENRNTSENILGEYVGSGIIYELKGLVEW